MDIGADILTELRALRAEVRDLRNAIASRRHLPDRDQDARLLSALALAFGASVFSVRELAQRAQREPELGAALRNVDARTLGWWFRRLQDDTDGPHVLTRVGRDKHGATWCISA